jgi:hypothetical protein
MTIKILISRRKLFMKLNKKFLASFTALTMAVTPMAAYADAADGTTSASSITGTGYVSTLDTEIYNVILPTDDSINFNVDPYGLLSIAKSTESKSLADVVSDAAGTVTSSATAVINKSSVGINVSVDVYLDEKVASNGAVKLASTKEEAEKGTADLYLVVENLSGASLDKSTVITEGAATITSEAIDVTANAIDLSGKAFTLSSQALTVTGAYASVTAAVVTATGAATSTSGAAATAPITFSLGDISEAYYVTASALTGGGASAEAVLSEGAVEYTSNNVYVFDITGYANPSSDVWQKIQDANSGLELTMKFTISKQGDATADEEVADPTTYVDRTSISTSNNVITLNLPDGVTLTSTSSIPVTKLDGTISNWTTQFTISGNKITITNTNAINNCKGGHLTLSFSNDTSVDIDIE